MNHDLKATPRKLSLNSETLKHLGEREADQAQGARGWTQDFGGPGLCSNMICAIA